ncbi:S-layer homology domain-containing protein [Anaerotignum faecicola]
MAKEQKKGKRFLPWLMVLSMMLSLTPVNAFAEESNDSTAESYCPDSESTTESSDESSDSSSEVSESNDAAEESSEDETTDAPEESEAASEDETDAALDAAFSVEAKAEAPATEESISTGSAVSEKAVVFAEESAAPPAEDVTYYPVYVYAYFANNGIPLNRRDNHPAAVVINDVKQEISWNEDASRGWYYITFGEVEKGTTEKPVKGASAKFTDNWDAMLDFKGVGSAAGNNFELSNVDTWGDLGFNTGATGFNAGNSWHLDGQIDVHAVTYAPNGEGVSNLPASSADNRVYYRGTYTVAAEEPEREGYTFKGWKQDDSETLLHAGDSITLTGDATLTAEWEKNASDSSETPRYYPVYVYARFINGATHLSGDTKVIKNGVKKTITWNEDSNKGVQSVYYITFGHVANGTDVAPTNGASATFKGNLNDVVAFDGIGSASANGFAPSDVDTWGNLGFNTGATGFSGVKASWHLDGDIHVYTVAYANGLDEASEETVTDMPEKDTNYYLGTYTVTTAVPTREGYTFDGWTLDGKQVGKTIDLSKISNKTAAEVTLTAQWKENAKPEQPAKKRHPSHTEDTAPVNPEVEIKDDEALGLNQADHYAYIVGYGNGEVRPQNSITRAEVASIFFRLLEDDVRDANYTRENNFTDVSSDAWYCSAVSTLSAMGILSGYPDAAFRPNASITRAEFAAIATRFDAAGDKTPASFDDIANHWAKDEISVAANNGWVNGYKDGSFRPQNNITRAETMSLVNRVLNRNPETSEDLLPDMITFTDNADTNAWYYLAVQEATNSHYNTSKENSAYEKWTGLRKTLD